MFFMMIRLRVMSRRVRSRLFNSFSLMNSTKTSSCFGRSLGSIDSLAALRTLDSSAMCFFMAFKSQSCRLFSGLGLSSVLNSAFCLLFLSLPSVRSTALLKTWFLGGGSALLRDFSFWELLSAGESDNLLGAGESGRLAYLLVFLWYPFRLFDATMMLVRVCWTYSARVV